MKPTPYPLLPWPPSVNHYWMRTRTGSRRSDKAERFLFECLAVMHDVPGDLRFMNGERLRLRINASPPDHRCRDLDNILKAILDGLQHAGVYTNDNQIDELTVTRFPVVKGGAVAVYLEEIA